VILLYKLTNFIDLFAIIAVEKVLW